MVKKLICKFKGHQPALIVIGHHHYIYCYRCEKVYT